MGQKEEKPRIGNLEHVLDLRNMHESFILHGSQKISVTKLSYGFCTFHKYSLQNIEVSQDERKVP